MKIRAFYLLSWLLPFLCVVHSAQTQWLRTSPDLFITSASNPIARFVGLNDRGPMPIDTVISNATASKGSINYSGGRMLYNPYNGALGLDTLHFQISIAGSPFEDEKSVAIIGNYNYLVCQDDQMAVYQNDTILIDVHANDYSKFAYNTYLTIAPLHGIGAVQNNQIQYIPNFNFIGIDSFQYYTTQTTAPFDSTWAWVRISVCPNTSPIITSSVPQFGGMQLNIVNSNALQLPLYYGIINDTNNKTYGYSAQHPVNSYAQTLFWNTPQMNGTHIGCVYVSDSRGCASRTCLTSYITNCNPPPSAAFVSNYDSLHNQLYINANTQNASTLHQWELSFQSPYIQNPLFTGSNASDSIPSILLPGNYSLMHISSDISMQCADTAVYNFQINLSDADTFSGYAFTDLNVDGLFQVGEPTAPAGTIIWVANKSKPLFYLTPNSSGFFSLELKSDSLIWGVTPASLTTVQTSPIRPLVYHTPKGPGHWHVRGLLFGLHPAAYHVHGRLYVDINGNNSIDNGEPILRNHSVSIKNKTLITDSAGVYHYFTSSTNSLTITPTSITGYNVSAQFLQPFAGIADYPVDISFIPQLNTFVNGEILLTADEDTLKNCNNTFVHLTNAGMQALLGTAILKYPDSIQVLFASDSGIVDSINHHITWQIKKGINCAQSNKLIACWKAATPNALLKFTGQLMVDTTLSDIDPSNNFDTMEMLNLNHLPNIKWASPVGKGSTHAIIPSQTIRYGICVKNPLSQPIVNITILDTLDKDLSYKTWKYLSSSITPSSVSFENGVVSITYNDCFQLPNTNASIESLFKVTPWPGLPLHKQIHNRATIYWDDQQHTHTNTVFHTIEYFLGVENLEEGYRLFLYPNPSTFNDPIYIGGEMPITSIQLFASNGSFICTKPVYNNSFTLDKSFIKAGCYIVQLMNHSKIIASKTIILE